MLKKLNMNYVNIIIGEFLEGTRNKCFSMIRDSINRRKYAIKKPSNSVVE